MTGYSSCVNGKNQAKKKEKVRIRRSEEEICRGEGCCSPRQKGSWMKNQSQVFHGEESLRCSKESFSHGEDIAHSDEEEAD